MREWGGPGGVPGTLGVQSRHLVERVEGEAFWLDGPLFADELIRRKALQGLEAPAEIVGRHEVDEVLPEIVMAVVVEALDGRVLDGAVHSLDLTVRPGITR